MNAVGKNLKQLRQREKLTQDALAERLHVTRQAVSSWETGKTQPDIETLTTLAEALNADVRGADLRPGARGKLSTRSTEVCSFGSHLCSGVIHILRAGNSIKALCAADLLGNI